MNPALNLSEMEAIYESIGVNVSIPHFPVPVGSVVFYPAQNFYLFYGVSGIVILCIGIAFGVLLHRKYMKIHGE